MQKLFIKPIANLPESQAFAKALYADYLSTEKNFTVMLEGSLGIGKTFLVRELLQCFGVTADITSPTYALVNEYTNHQNQQFAHFDFYRLQAHEDFFARGFTDIADDQAVSCFVEWPEKISDLAQDSFAGTVYKLHLDDQRTVTLFKK